MAKVKKKSVDKNIEAKRKMERDRKRKYREKIKGDLVKSEKIKEYDRDRKRKNKEDGKTKTINDMGEREKRAQRKKWRIATKKYRQNLKHNNVLTLDTPPGSPEPARTDPPTSSESKRNLSAKKKVRNRRERDKRVVLKTQRALDKALKKADKWRKRYKRLKEEKNATPSPKKVVEKILKSGPAEVKKNYCLE